MLRAWALAAVLAGAAAQYGDPYGYQQQHQPPPHAQQQYQYQEHDAVRLSDVTALTLRRGAYTTARRTAPVPQLNCVGGSAGCRYQPDVVQCTNAGSDGYDVQWKCEADLDKSVRFGNLNVGCEGYSGPNDPLVLRGSCGLEYTLENTGHRSSGTRDYSYSSHEVYHDNGGGAALGKLIMYGIMFYIFFGLLRSWFAPRAPGGYYGGGPGGGGGFDGGPGGGGGGGGGYGGGPYPSGGAGPQPGFWTGVGLGGLGGYMFGRPRGYARPVGGYGGYGGGYARPRPAFGGARMGGGGGGGTRAASGFGGTTRR